MMWNRFAKSLPLPLALLAALAAADDCERFTQYNSKREGNRNLEDEYRIINTPAACSTQCTATSGCECFSYNLDNNRCFLMSACKTPTIRGNFISGVSGCEVPPPSREECKVTVRTAAAGLPVLRHDRKGIGRMLQKVADCAGGGAVYKVEWIAGSENDYKVHTIYRIGCRHSNVDLFHDHCATDALLQEWERDEAVFSNAREESESNDNQKEDINNEPDLVVQFNSMPELTGRYHRSIKLWNKAPLWRSDDCNNGGLGCVMFSSNGGYWMISNTPDGNTRNVGSVKSVRPHAGESPNQMQWEVHIGKEWKEGSGVVDTVEGMKLRGIDWQNDEYGQITVFIPEAPSVAGTYRAVGRFRDSPLYRSADCATGACVIFTSAGGYWMISGREDGHHRNVGLVKTEEQSSATIDGPNMEFTWQFRRHQKWALSTGTVGPTEKLKDKGFTVQESALVIAIPEVPEVNGLYRAEGRHRGLPLYRSDDCRSTKCAIFASASGRWIVAEEGAELRDDLCSVRAGKRIPHGALGPDGKWMLTTDWEGQPDLEPTSVETWEFPMNHGWGPSSSGSVMTRYHSKFAQNR